MNDEVRYRVYRDGDMRARLDRSRLRLYRRDWPLWLCRLTVALGWKYGGWSHVWLVCTHRLGRVVSPWYVAGVRRAMRAETNHWIQRDAARVAGQKRATGPIL